MRIIALLVWTLFLSNVIQADEAIKGSIVKIFTVSKIPSYSTPWNSNIRRSHASGAIIEGNRILTNAHVVANETFIEVKRYGDTKRYEARVEFISHQADLALLRVEEKGFFDGVKPLQLDGLPQIQQKVTVYGFPRGGSSLSVSEGVVSRIEHNRYVHSREIFLSIQIDAAINPGSSGGPAISDGKVVGVVMQQITKAQSIGYLVPVEVVRHFLKDVEDGQYDGFVHLGISTEMMINKSLHKLYHMTEIQSGVLLIDMSELSSGYGVLQRRDVLMAIDGHNIENDGTVEFRKHQFTSYKYYVDKKQVGDMVVFTVLRKGKIEKVRFKLMHTADKYLLVNTFGYDNAPKYLIYGGYVFSPLTRNLLMNSKASLLDLRELAGRWATKEKQEVVVLLKVLATENNRGDHSFSLWTVDKIDGKYYRDYKEFVEILRGFSGKQLVLEDKEGVQISIDTKQAQNIEVTVLKRYGIKNINN